MKNKFLRLILLAALLINYLPSLHAQVNESDSLSLISIYNALDGDNWTKNDGWKTDPVSNWYGITIEGNRVTKIELPSNNLTGVIPSDIGYIPYLQIINLNSNSLQASIPQEVGNLSNLIELHLSNNQLSGELYSLEGLNNLTSLDISDNQFSGNAPYLMGSSYNLINIANNNFDYLSDFINISIGELNLSGNNFSFGDFSNANISATTFIYSPQKPVKAWKKEFQAAPNYALNISVNEMTNNKINNAENTYQWYKDGSILSGAILETYTIEVLGDLELGDYYCVISNPNYPNLILTTETIQVSYLSPNAGIDQKVCANTAYMNGNYPEPYTGTWTVVQGSAIVSSSNEPYTMVTGLQLGENIFSWAFNGESDTVSITVLPNLYSENITAGPDQSFCEGVKVISLNGATVPSTIDNSATGNWSSYNYAVFDSPESPNTNVSELSLGENKLFWNIQNECSSKIDTVKITINENPTIPIPEILSTGTSSISISNESLPNETDQWTLISGTGTFTENSMGEILIDGLSLGQTVYSLDRTDEFACSSSKMINIYYETSTSREDSLALVALYNATNGYAWYKKDNWTQGPISSWYGVILDNAHHVIGLELAENNLNGYIPSDIGNLEFLESLNLSNNKLTSTIPTEVSMLSHLKSLDLSFNNLTGSIPNKIGKNGVFGILIVNDNNFQDLTNWQNIYLNELQIQNNSLTFSDFNNTDNIEIDSVNFSPQKDVKLSIEDLQVTLNGSFTLDAKALSNNELKDPLNIYQWYKNQTMLTNSSNISGATTSQLSISPVSAMDLGDYYCLITNSDFDELTLQTTSVNVHFAEVNAGIDQNVCNATAQLNAISPSEGIWSTIGIGSAVIETPTSAQTNVSNLAAGLNSFRWTSTTGFDDVNIIMGSVGTVDAGADTTICEDYGNLTATTPSFGTGRWTVIAGNGIIEAPSTNNTWVNNLNLGTNTFEWTVSTSDGCTSSDQVTITNKQVIANAGSDTTIYSNAYPIPDANTFLDANPTVAGETGIWTTSNSSAVIVSPSLYNTEVTSLNAGSNFFTWTVSNADCSSSDYLTIISANVITNAGATVTWDNPDDWIPAIVPSFNDSVYLHNCTVTIKDIQALFRSLRIGSGAIVNVSGSLIAKPAGSLSGGNIVIQQDVEKSDAKIGIATLNIGSGGQVVIQQDVEKSTKSIKSGLNIGSGGQVVIQQDVEKSTKGISAILTMQTNTSITVSETNASATNPEALLNIGNGGQVLFQNGYSQGVKFVTTPSLSIGSGGQVVIQQDVEKKAKGAAAIYMPSGGQIVIQQDVEKSTSKAVNGTLRLSGGNIVIQQDVEKSANKAKLEPNLLVKHGGSVIIEPSAINGSLSVPVIKVAGGDLSLGNSKKVTGNAYISTGQIVIQQDVEKSLYKTAPDFNVSSNGVISFYDIPGNTADAYFIVGKNIAVNVGTGAKITAPTTNARAIMDADEESSIVDPNSIIDGTMILRQKFKANVSKLITPPVTGAFAKIFEKAELGTWSEIGGQWKAFGFVDALKPVNGFRVRFTEADTIPFIGIPNRGIQSIELSNTILLDDNKQGFNLIGNPFAAAIDWEVIDLSDVDNVLYTFNPITQNFGIYQKGGYSLNGADQYINGSEGFFVKAKLASVLPKISFDQAATLHNIPGLVKETAYKTSTEGLKLSVSDGTNSDQILLRFDDQATLGFDEGLDAFKFFAFNTELPQLYTVGTNDEELAINVAPTPKDNEASKVIPLDFKSTKDGNYTINVDEFTFTGAYVMLKDKKEDKTIDLRTISTYSFDWAASDSPARFELIFNTTTGIESLNNQSNIEIYSHKQTIFINSDKNHAKVEIYNLNGTKITENEINSLGITSFEFKQPAGTYLVKVVSDNNVTVRKVFISE